jgi:hypothetical protein
VVPEEKEPVDGTLYRAEERASGTVSFSTYKTWFRSGALFPNGSLLTALLVIVLYATTQGLKVFADLFLGMWAASGDTQG